jgi:hypothetical protein
LDADAVEVPLLLEEVVLAVALVVAAEVEAAVEDTVLPPIGAVAWPAIWLWTAALKLPDILSMLCGWRETCEKDLRNGKDDRKQNARELGGERLGGELRLTRVLEAKRFKTDEAANLTLSQCKLACNERCLLFF